MPGSALYARGPSTAGELATAVPDPSSTLSTVLSLLPPFAPVLMPVRMATGDAAAWQVAFAMLLTLATAAWFTWLAGRIYANSVLRVGPRSSSPTPFAGGDLWGSRLGTASHPAALPT